MKTSRAAAACLLIVLLGVPGVSALVDDLESYTEPPFDPANPPLYNWTETVGANMRVVETNDHATSGNHALLWAGFSGSGHAVFEDLSGPEVNKCFQGDFGFQARVNALSDSGSGPDLFVGMSGNGAGAFQSGTAAKMAYLSFDQDTGGVSFKVRDDGGGAAATSASFGLTMSLNTTYSFRMFCFEDTPGGAVHVGVTETSTGWYAQTDSPQTAFQSNDAIDYFGWGQSSVGSSAGSKYYFDDIVIPVADAVSGPLNLTLTDSVAVTNLVGFDVDTLGSWVITRQTDQGTDGFDEVAVYDGQNLVKGASVDTGCERTHGVASLPTAVTYLWCDPANGGDQNIKEIHVKSPSLNTPDWPGQCSAYCVDEISVDELEGNNALYREVQDVKAFPFDYSVSFHENQLDRTYMAWAFGDVLGRAGVVTLTQINNHDDNSQFDAVTVDSSSVPQVDQICTVSVSPYSGGSAQDYLIAGTQNSVTKVYDVDFTKDTIGVFPATFPTMLVDVSPKEGGSAPTTANQAMGLGCGQQPRYVVATALNKVVVVDYSGTQSSVLWSVDATTEERGVAMSQDGLWVAWLDDDGSGSGNGTVYLANSTTGEVTGTIDVPQDPDAGVGFVGMALDANAQNMWLAFDDQIYRYEVFEATTGEPIGAGSTGAGDFGPEPESDQPEGSLFGGLATDASGVLGETGNRLFAAGLLVFGFMSVGAGAFGVGEKKKGGGGIEVAAGATLGGSIGAAFGVVMAVATDLVPKEWAFVLALFLALAIGGWFFLRRG